MGKKTKLRGPGGWAKKQNWGDRAVGQKILKTVENKSLGDHTNTSNFFSNSQNGMA
jgi:hypothetical protein